MPDTPASKVALVTGAASGIGRAAAFAFAREGYALVISDRDEAPGQEVRARLEADGADALFVRCDVSSEEEVRTLIARTLDRFGRLDAAYNNAGIEGIVAPADECTTENFDRVIAVNLRGVWLCMREEIRQMRAQGGGAVVNCASVAGLVGFAGIPAYCASKHAVIGLTRTAALELGPHNIRVNAVCPGAIETPMLERVMGGTDEGRRQMVAMEPIGRIGRPEEIADAVVWMCSDRASFVTGQAIAVDGGWTAR